MKITLPSLIVLFFFSCSATKGLTDQPVTLTDDVWNVNHTAAFEQELGKLQNRYHLPSLSAGIVNEKQLVWKKGLGNIDVESSITVDENTVYHIASVTKTFGSILLMQLVEQGKVSLDDPITKYGVNLRGRWAWDKSIKVKHLLTHTAMGSSFNGFKPGRTFRYNGDWYHQLKIVIEKASGRTIAELLLENIVTPLGLKNTVPSVDDSVAFSLFGSNKEEFLTQVAKPYNWEDGRLVPVQFNYVFGPAAGIMSSVSDLAIYSNAIDEGMFLKPDTWNEVLTPFKNPKGKNFQYGLGWFVKDYNDVKIIWHTGWWNGYSALFVKIPDKDLTFIILVNSQDASRPFYSLSRRFLPFKKNLNKTLLASDFAKVFLEYFAVPQK